MANNNPNSNNGLYFIVGILTVIIVGIAVYNYTDFGQKPDLEIDVSEDGISVDGN